MKNLNLYKSYIKIIAIILVKVIEFILIKKVVFLFIKQPMDHTDYIVDICVLILIMSPFTYIVTRQIKRLKEAETTYRTLADDSLVGIYMFQDGKFTYANQQLLNLIGYSINEIAHLNVYDLVVPEDRASLQAAIDRKLSGAEKFSVLQLRIIKKDQSLIDVEVYGTLEIKDHKPFIIGSAIDITRHKENENELKKLAYNDLLTGLPNRRYLEQKLVDSLDSSKTQRIMGAILFLDLDGFKQVNDSFGHNTGDTLLKNVATTLLSCVRHDDIVSRLGGDEFMILLSNVSKKEVTAIARRIIKQINQPLTLSNKNIHISTSIGIVFYPNHGSDPTELINKADKAMYHAKTCGKNTYYISA